MKKAFLVFSMAVLCIITVTAQQEDRLFREAERRFQKGDYQFAYSRYEQLITEYPDSGYVADAKFRQAVIHTYLGRADDALKMFERISERYPNTRFFSYIPFWQGYNLFQLGKYDTALEYFSAYIDGGGGPLYRDALFYKALCQRNLMEREEALVSARLLYQLYESPVEEPRLLLLYSSLLVETERYEQLFELYADVPFDLLDETYRERLSLYRAEALFQQGRLEEAEPLFLELLDREDDIQATAYKRLFVLYGQTGRQEEQQSIFDEAQSHLGNRPELLAEFLLRAGIQQYRNGEYDVAQSYLRRIWRTMAIEEIDGLVSLYLASIYERKGELEEAVRVIEEFMQASDDRHEDLLFTLGRIENSRQNWMASAGIMEKFLTEYDDSKHRDEARYIYAYDLYRTGRYRESLTIVQEGFSEGEGAAFDRELLRLRSRLYIELDQPGNAVNDLREYIPRYPRDIDAYVDLVKLLFQEGEYEKLHQTVDEVKEIFTGEDERPAVFKAIYMDGMASLRQGKYADAEAAFDRLETAVMQTAGQDDLVPYVLFYKGWISYQNGEYSRAADWFSRLMEEYPQSDRVNEAIYLSGWAGYADNDFMLAQESFGSYSRRDLPRDEKVRGLFMYAKSSAALGKSDDALLMYRTIYTDYSRSSLADDALFEYAALLNGTGRGEDAVEAYYSVYTSYPTSPLGEEALFRRGDLLYRMGEYRKARDAFYEHRIRFPGGSLIDLSLYWSGHSALKIGQPYGAVLVWEKLTAEYPGSSLYSETLLELARLYTDLGEYQLSVSAYTRYLASNPTQAAEREAQVQIATLKRIMAGQGSREAELTVQLERSGIGSPQGNAAALELVRLYLYQYPEKISQAYELLQRLSESENLDRRSMAEVRYLTGEYYRKKSLHSDAAAAYARAAVTGAGDDDLVARSLLKAAESAAAAGDYRTARQMVQKLKSDFPHTQWVIEGESLLDRIDGRSGAGE